MVVSADGEGWQLEHRGLGGSETRLRDILMVDACHYPFAQTPRTCESEPCRVTIVCHCRFLDYSKCPTLLRVLVMGSVCVGAGAGHGKALYLLLYLVSTQVIISGSWDGVPCGALLTRESA